MDKLFHLDQTFGFVGQQAMPRAFIGFVPHDWEDTFENLQVLDEKEKFTGEYTIPVSGDPIKEPTECEVFDRYVVKVDRDEYMIVFMDVNWIEPETLYIQDLLKFEKKFDDHSISGELRVVVTEV